MLRYAVEGDKVQRIEPIALSPKDFVDEWLSSRWEEITQWSEPGLGEVHKRLRLSGDTVFQDQVEHCRSGLWEVPLYLREDDDEVYLFVTEQGDHQCRMIAASKDECETAKQ